MDARIPDPSEGRRRGVLARLRPVEPAPTTRLEALLQKIRQGNAKADLKLIERAYAFAEESHRDQFRASGEHFIEHPLEVALILADLNLDTTTMVAALLHDVVEDTDMSIADIERDFGADAAHIIDGVTKLDKITFRSKEEHQAETLRKMIIAMSKDIRVLLIKLADRLHNMRTIGHLARDTQELKARETLEIYAPLAHRLGIHQIKWQLEDLSFATLYPKQFDEIVRMVEERQPERQDVVVGVIEDLETAFRNMKIKGTISGRPKHFWSIYQKMVIRGREFGDIYDLVGIRVVTDTVRDCYAALGVIHGLWKPVPSRFKDYIAMPKFNMYQSLHTTVVGPGGKPLEIQIRTEAMNRTAEYGIAAHWKYKHGKDGKDGKGGDDVDLAWLRQMLDWQREQNDPRDFMESLRIDLYQDEVFVFTPKGDVMSFTRGATPIDFAYAIHTEVGHRCVGARVNGRLVPLTTELESGDTVEVITSKAADAGPSQDWLQIVKSPRARNKIRQWFTRERREDAIEKGREDLARALRKAAIPLQQAMSSGLLLSVATELHYPSFEAMLAAIGEGTVSPKAIIQRLEHEVEGDEDILPPPTKPERMRRPSDHGVIVEGMDDVLVRLARCCTPVPSDPIMGFVTRGRGVSVHRTDCPNAKALLAEAERMLNVRWDDARRGMFTVGIIVHALDRTKLLRDVTNTISDLGVNILASSTHTDPRTRTAALRFSVELADPQHLEHILHQIKRVDSVYDAARHVPSAARTP